MQLWRYKQIWLLQAYLKECILEKSHDVIISAFVSTNKILSRDSNYIVYMVMRPKFSNPFILRVKLSQLLARFLSHESESPHELPNNLKLKIPGNKGIINKSSKMLGIEVEYSTCHPIQSFDSYDKNCEKSAVNYFLAKPILSNFVNLTKLFCLRL